MPADAERPSRSHPIVVAPGPPEFELQALGWRAFQDLCGVILREVFDQSFQIFADSNDAGRDGAYYGTWIGRLEESGTLHEVPSAPCVLQCKFTAKRDQTLTLSVVQDEIQKAERLVARNLCCSYILMTNARVTGESEAAIRAVLLAVGVRYVLVVQKSWICQTIAASQNLRMFVPRVYGLGDLSQIIDERAYAQAASLLSFLDDNLSTFVITDAYNRAAEALRSHGFVLLLGEPAVGKSVIAATLAVTALDSWGCRTILADDPDDLVRHWNPHEKQFIWVDDAFGMLRHDRTLTNKWARRLPKVMSAIRAGTKVVMTSRDYIYREARPLLKEYAFPLLSEQQVIVDVASLSRDERRQIVYNHVKLGNQPQDVRRRMKPYLADAADCTPFRPEVARRLGRRELTPTLQLSREGVLQFMSRPVEFLAEVYSGLDSSHISALALVYLEGDLVAPLSLSESQANVLVMLGGNIAATAEALVALEGPFLRRGSLPGMSPGAEHWSFRHPSLREGFASFIGTTRILSISL